MKQLALRGKYWPPLRKEGKRGLLALLAYPEALVEGDPLACP